MITNIKILTRNVIAGLLCKLTDDTERDLLLLCYNGWWCGDAAHIILIILLLLLPWIRLPWFLLWKLCYDDMSLTTCNMSARSHHTLHHDLTATSFFLLYYATICKLNTTPHHMKSNRHRSTISNSQLLANTVAQRTMRVMMWDPVLVIFVRGS
jgi:hypothetical protein